VRAVIADDSSLPRDILRQVLTKAGYQILAACANGQQVIDAVAADPPDFVVLDVSMPVLTGDAAARIIRERFPKVRVIMASSAGQDAIRKPLEAIGCAFVSKPYNKDQFLKALVAHLR